MKILHLTLKKKWFDMVGNEKPEEYRAITSYWINRLTDHFHQFDDGRIYVKWKEFDEVLFANGGHFGNVPKKQFIISGFEIREGNPKWGAEPGKIYFVIKLGEPVN
jgi:hypothetical protein